MLPPYRGTTPPWLNTEPEGRTSSKAYSHHLYCVRGGYWFFSRDVPGKQVLTFRLRFGSTLRKRWVGYCSPSEIRSRCAGGAVSRSARPRGEGGGGLGSVPNGYLRPNRLFLFAAKLRRSHKLFDCPTSCCPLYPSLEIAQILWGINYLML